ncbi:MAG: 2-C-methyl-D-erythritol 2,4-cyclodiphosphate synthase [Candidatus Omnitrophica bacterium]|nr:2-C-methyl-D-erythritol 2,4-cyclodiphosphate synthase [Candidatus Omnitrophota bacterium]
MEIRTGFGFDSHRFARGRKLFLGGVEINSNFGLKGTSDADIVIHAVCDALLGAVSERDIGEHFPDTDKNNKGRSSLDFLTIVKEIIMSKNYKLANIDITVVIERPNLTPYKEKIKNKIAEILNIEPARISVKAKHSEGSFPKKTAVCFASVLLVHE